MIINARIESMYLGLSHQYNFQDDAFVLCLALRTEQGMAKLGDYMLDAETFDSNGKYKGRKVHANVGEVIRALLSITDAHEWRDIQGAYIRCDLAEGNKFKILRIGHILQNAWIDLSSWLKGGAEDERD